MTVDSHDVTDGPRITRDRFTAFRRVLEAILISDFKPESLALHAVEDEFGEAEAMLQIFAEEYARTMETNARLDAERLELIEKQRQTIAELATPVIEVWEDVVTLPIVGSVDTKRSEEMTERLLRTITTRRTRNVIIDLTGVDVVDTSTANHLIRMVRAAQMLGSHCVLTGLGARVAHTLVELDVDLGGITTLRSLKEGLEEIVKGRPASMNTRGNAS